MTSGCPRQNLFCGKDLSCCKAFASADVVMEGSGHDTA